MGNNMDPDQTAPWDRKNIICITCVFNGFKYIFTLWLCMLSNANDCSISWLLCIL